MRGELPGNTQGTSGKRLGKYLLERECIQIQEYCWVFSLTLGGGFVQDQQTLSVFLGWSHWPPLPSLLQAVAGNKWIELLNCWFLWAVLWQNQVCVDGKLHIKHNFHLAQEPVISAACGCLGFLGLLPLDTSSPPKRVMVPLRWPLEHDQLSQVIGLSLWNNLMVSALLCAPESSRKVCALQQQSPPAPRGAVHLHSPRPASAWPAPDRHCGAPLQQPALVALEETACEKSAQIKYPDVYGQKVHWEPARQQRPIWSVCLEA